jgi:hypothetical protein
VREDPQHGGIGTFEFNCLVEAGVDPSPEAAEGLACVLDGLLRDEEFMAAAYRGLVYALETAELDPLHRQSRALGGIRPRRKEQAA